MDIQHKDDGKNGSFYIESEGQTLAEMTYVWTGPGMIIIDHTEVSPALAGQGAGKQMLAKAIEFVQEKNVKIIPLCPFAKSVFDKTPEYRDVLVG